MDDTDDVLLQDRRLIPARDAPRGARGSPGSDRAEVISGTWSTGLLDA